MARRLFSIPRTLLAVACAAPLALAGCLGGPSAYELGEVPSAEDLYQEGREILAEGSEFLWLFDTTDYQGAINKFQDIIDNYPYSDYAVLAELAIADTFYQEEKWEEALSYYRDFAGLHPDHPRVAHTLLRTALCHYKQSRDEGRDQTFTRLAVKNLDQVQRRFPHSPEAAEAETLWLQLRTRLGSHVLMIGDFYLDREEFQSAAERYRSVLNDYPGLGLDPEALYKLGVCFESMQREEEASRIFQVILDNYGDTEIAEAAAEFLPEQQVPAAN
jgi:outer membrane protein assembly factor BamD